MLWHLLLICTYLCIILSYHGYLCSTNASIRLITTPNSMDSISPSTGAVAPKSKILFGEDAGWDHEDWTSSDDRVRGGRSQSHLTISGSYAVFHGDLDIKTLAGAGFASQRTTGDNRDWNLSDYEGITLTLGMADKKKYTFIIKDEVLPPTFNGSEQSTVSYEYDFEVDAQKTELTAIFIPWNDLKATYRGKQKEDARNLNPKKIKRFAIMMRSFFGTQDGDFSLTIKGIAASSRPVDIIAPTLQDVQSFFGWLLSKVWKS